MMDIWTPNLLWQEFIDEVVEKHDGILLQSRPL